ncbi:MAG: hypothetical protein V1806_16400 [Pseudomonadota bacterium]
MARLARRAGRAATALFLALAALSGVWPGPALGAEALPPTPWHLAVVVDCSAGMTEPWLGATRLELIEPALQTELYSLPLRAVAGVWVVGGGPGQAREFIAPRPSLELRDTNLVLPRLGGTADLAAGLGLALGWLKGHQPGALLVISGDLARPLASWPPPGAPEAFRHALALAPRDAGQEALQELALRGGGAYFRVAKVDQVAPLLHRAVLVALSPASLLVLAHDSDNRPQSLVYTLGRRDQLALDRQGLSGRPCQLLPGVYQVGWPAGHALGPAKPPALASVAVGGQTRLWTGGTGRLMIKALDPQGRELPWAASVSNLDTGKVEVPEKRTPFEAVLPAGVYRVKIPRPALTWTVELGADKRVDLVTGPQGSLNIALNGPSGPWRVPFNLEDKLGLRPGGTGYTGSAMPLLPGLYRVQVQVVPAWEREFRLAPGQDLRLEMPSVGGILVRRDKAGLSQSYQVLDTGERPLATGIGDRPLPVLPGRYLLYFPNQAATLPVEVQAGGLTALDPPLSASAH